MTEEFLSFPWCLIFPKKGTSLCVFLTDGGKPLPDDMGVAIYLNFPQRDKNVFVFAGFLSADAPSKFFKITPPKDLSVNEREEMVCSMTDDDTEIKIDLIIGMELENVETLMDRKIDQSAEAEKRLASRRLLLESSKPVIKAEKSDFFNFCNVLLDEMMNFGMGFAKKLVWNSPKGPVMDEWIPLSRFATFKQKILRKLESDPFWWKEESKKKNNNNNNNNNSF